LKKHGNDETIGVETMEAIPSHNLPGIQVDDALARLGVGWQQYLGLLHRFADDIQAPLASLQERVAQQDWEGARGQAMTLSIECMQICADELRQQAKELDQALRSKSPNSAHLAARLAEGIERLLRAISACDNPFEDAGVQELLGGLYDYEQIEKTLLQLESALNSNEANRSAELLDQWEKIGIPPDLLEGFKQIKSLIQAAQFEDAAAIASILKSGLPRR